MGNPRAAAFMRGPTLVASPNPIAIGNTTNFVLFYQPNSVATLYLSDGPVTVPLPPFGNLELNPVVLIPIGGALLSAQGLGAIPIPVPANLALANSTVYLQAILADPFRPHFSNPVDLAITP
jgi:hypothetical protein